MAAAKRLPISYPLDLYYLSSIKSTALNLNDFMKLFKDFRHIGRYILGKLPYLPTLHYSFVLL